MDTPTPDVISTLRTLTTTEQFEVITDAMLGEEGEHFIELIGQPRRIRAALLAGHNRRQGVRHGKR